MQLGERRIHADSLGDTHSNSKSDRISDTDCQPKRFAEPYSIADRHTHQYGHADAVIKPDNFAYSDALC